MSQAKAINTTNTRPVSMLDAINPNRERFAPKPCASTIQLIDVLAIELAAKNGPVFPKRQKAPQNPYINHYGKILDPEMAAQWQIAQRKGGAL